MASMPLHDTFLDPPKEFSVLPFWFWNDELDKNELLRQIDDFERHGVHGFVIHPRMGLPRKLGWMSEELLGFMRLAIDEAARRGMKVVLYDEGMYPSGSSCGQVVARNPGLAARALWKIDLGAGEEPRLEAGWKLLGIFDRPHGARMAVVDRPSGGTIRGIHYVDEEKGSEEEPAAADILNPEAVASFIEWVYEKYAQAFGAHFGKTIVGIFTDEPAEMGRTSIKGLVPGSQAVLARINEILGADFTEHLPDLWHEDRPDSLKWRRAYHGALHRVLGEVYYGALSKWCEAHGTALVGHPGASDDLGFERFFHIPGQDLVWRYVEPGPKALEGAHATMAKCAASAMVHLGRRRNGNELYGAYGHELTFEEVRWLAHWCFVRGQNLLYPHAFYYSVRGPRRDERPPDVGPHASWWTDFKPFADACRRLSWINTDSTPVCGVAILAGAASLPEKAAACCFRNQVDFHYLEARHLWEDAKVDGSGVHLAGMHYPVLVLEAGLDVPANALPFLEALARDGRLVCFGDGANGIPKALHASNEAALVAVLRRASPPALTVAPAVPSLRVRHVVKEGAHFFLLFNEERVDVAFQISLPGFRRFSWWDTETGVRASADLGAPVPLRAFEARLLYAEKI